MGLYTIRLMNGDGNTPNCYVMWVDRGGVQYFYGKLAISSTLARILPAMMSYPIFNRSYPLMGPKIPPEASKFLLKDSDPKIGEGIVGEFGGGG